MFICNGNKSIEFLNDYNQLMSESNLQKPEKMQYSKIFYEVRLIFNLDSVGVDPSCDLRGLLYFIGWLGS